MKINIYTIVGSEHLVNTASDADYDDLSCWSQTFTCKGAALEWLQNDIESEVSRRMEGRPDWDEEDLLFEVDRIYGDGTGASWVWECAEASYLWRLVEQEIEIPGFHDSQVQGAEAVDDTVSRYMTHCAGDDCEAHVEV